MVGWIDYSQIGCCDDKTMDKKNITFVLLVLGKVEEITRKSTFSPVNSTCVWYIRFFFKLSTPSSLPLWKVISLLFNAGLGHVTQYRAGADSVQALKYAGAAGFALLYFYHCHEKSFSQVDASFHPGLWNKHPRNRPKPKLVARNQF